MGMERLILCFLKDLALGEMPTNQYMQKGYVSITGRHTCAQGRWLSFLHEEVGWRHGSRGGTGELVLKE